MIFFQFDEEYGYNERNMDIFFFFFWIEKRILEREFLLHVGGGKLF